jgi:RNA polymerase sigma factor (TIGR02999 family)
MMFSQGRGFADWKGVYDCQLDACEAWGGREIRDMKAGETTQITRWLRRLREGDSRAESRLYAAAYKELRRIAAAYMRREHSDHVLQTTALVHEAYLKLVDQKQADWRDRAHFLGVAAKIMRRILVDYARVQRAQKRGAGVEGLPLDDALVYRVERSQQLVSLDEALERLEKQDSRACQVIELRFFGGLSTEEIAEVLRISPTTVKREWSFGRSWLQSELR